MMTWLTPSSRSMREDVSPVCEPLGSQNRFCAPTFAELRATTFRTSDNATNGGQITKSGITLRPRNVNKLARARATLSRTPTFIFQLATTVFIKKVERWRRWKRWIRATWQHAEVLD